MLAVVPVLLLLGLAVPPPGDGSLWGNLERGSHDAGFQFLYVHDLSRVWSGTRRDRPIRISFWYPARPRTGTAMLYRDYIPESGPDPLTTRLNVLLARRELADLKRDLSPADVTALLAFPVMPRWRATPSPGKFPLVLYAAGLNSSTTANAVLCEYLASHGYVVVSVPQLGESENDVDLVFDALGAEMQVEDLLFALGTVSRRSPVGGGPFSVVGHSLGGLTGVMVAMRRSDVAAIAALDPPFNVTPYVSRVVGSPLFDPRRLRMPILNLHKSEAGATFTATQAMKYAERYVIGFRGMLHADFTSFPMTHPRFSATRADRTAGGARQGYELVCRTVRAFLDWKQRGRATAGSRIATLLREKPVPVGDVLEYAPLEVPPTEEEFAGIVAESGYDRAADVLRKHQAADPAAAIIDEARLNSIGYRLLAQKDLPGAIALLRLNILAHPTSANVFDSLGEAYGLAGETRLAVENYERALQLDPNLETAKRALEKLRP